MSKIEVGGPVVTSMLEQAEAVLNELKANTINDSGDQESDESDGCESDTNDIRTTKKTSSNPSQNTG